MHEFSDGYGGNWDWYPYAACHRIDADVVYAVAFWMVYDLLKTDAGIHDVDPFHLVSAEGLLSVGHLKTLKSRVWK